METRIELEGLSRRDLLKLSLAAGTLSAAGGALLPGCSPPMRRSSSIMVNTQMTTYAIATHFANLINAEPNRYFG